MKIKGILYIYIDINIYLFFSMETYFVCVEINLPNAMIPIALVIPVLANWYASGEGGLNKKQIKGYK